MADQLVFQQNLGTLGKVKVLQAPDSLYRTVLELTNETVIFAISDTYEEAEKTATRISRSLRV
jgi:hypothetical protein